MQTCKGSSTHLTHDALGDACLNSKAHRFGAVEPMVEAKMVGTGEGDYELQRPLPQRAKLDAVRSKEVRREQCLLVAQEGLTLRVQLRGTRRTRWKASRYLRAKDQGSWLAYAGCTRRCALGMHWHALAGFLLAACLLIRSS